jgi:N6-adenosine-specific RNA methylase IME4
MSDVRLGAGGTVTRLFAPPAPFQGLGADYDLIMADPPWPTKMRSAKGEKKSSVAVYGFMSFEAIAALPVGALAARNCVLFLWTINSMVVYGGNPDRHYVDADAARSRVGEVVKAWGFRFVTQGTWVKTTKKGGIAIGTGYRARNAGDPWWICTRGNPQTSRRLRNVFFGLRRQHSRKPEEAYAWCEQYVGPDKRLAELFSRTPRAGWDTWGEQAGHFEPVVCLDAAGRAA